MHGATRIRLLDSIATMATTAISAAEPHWTHPDVPAAPGRESHPIFFGAFDWHSAVHGHWTLARCARSSDDTDHLVELLDQRITADGVAGEMATLATGVLDRFEVPYGLVWLVRLHHELRADTRLVGAADVLEPLARLADDRLKGWLRGLRTPVETGLHANTAFALGQLREAEASLWREARPRILEWWSHLDGEGLAEEPGPHDFLSPVLETIDVVTSVLEPSERASWVRASLSDSESRLDALSPVSCPDPSDGRSSHLLGLNLSRAAALSRTASRLQDARLKLAFDGAAARHREVGLRALDESSFATTHWIATFALMAVEAADV